VFGNELSCQLPAYFDGFDAVIVGCCYDPGVRVCRELVDIPVIGPLEASMQMASYFGHNYVVITDHGKAVPYLRDLVRVYGGENCRDVSCIDWWVIDMIKDTPKVAQDAHAAVQRQLNATGAEAAILACTIISACYEKAIQQSGRPHAVPVLNPNTIALKMAESLADLHRAGSYPISRTGYYRKPQEKDAAEFAQVRAQYGKAGAQDVVFRAKGTNA